MRGYPGSYGHYEQDAATFADWGVDPLKFDRCAPTVDQTGTRALLPADGRRVACDRKADHLLAVQLGRSTRARPPWEWAPAFAHMWRTTTDIFP